MHYSRRRARRGAALLELHAQGGRGSASIRRGDLRELVEHRPRERNGSAHMTARTRTRARRGSWSSSAPVGRAICVPRGRRAPHPEKQARRAARGGRTRAPLKAKILAPRRRALPGRSAGGARSAAPREARGVKLLPAVLALPALLLASAIGAFRSGSASAPLDARRSGAARRKECDGSKHTGSCSPRCHARQVALWLAQVGYLASAAALALFGGWWLVNGLILGTARLHGGARDHGSRSRTIAPSIQRGSPDSLCDCFPFSAASQYSGSCSSTMTRAPTSAPDGASPS